MAVTLGTNLGALKAVRYAAQANRELEISFERLSSGQRINRASDDAAGLSISSSLNADSRIYSQAIKNINDGVSYLGVAQGGLDQLTRIITRVRELSEQSANGVYTTVQRQAMSSEVTALQNEYNRIVEGTTFNRQRILQGEGPSQLQAGYGSEEAVSIVLSSSGSYPTSPTVTALGTFSTRTTFTSGASPQAIDTADFNGDGIADLVVGDYNISKASVFLGNGNGTFKARVSLQSVGGPQMAIAGDLNADGKMDFVLAGLTSNSLSIFLGNGNGTFKSHVSYATGASPKYVNIADLSGDGTPDLVIANNTGASVSVLIGNGNGTYFSSVTYTTGSQPTSVFARDLNGDGNKDLITGDSGSNVVSVLLGNGNGTFLARRSYSAYSGSRQLSVEDFNGDGATDILSIESANAGVVLLGNGNGSFSGRVTYFIASTTQAVEAADINGDGKIDFVTAEFNSPKVSVFFGNGNGTFLSRTSYTAGGGPLSITIGDFNGDGVPDLSTAESQIDAISIFIQDTATVQNGSPPVAIISGLDVSTAQAARTTLDRSSDILSTLNLTTAHIGSAMSRLQTSLSTLSARTENFRAAASRILDSDTAVETGRLIKTQILQQMSSAVLAQANQQLLLAVELLK